MLDIYTDYLICQNRYATATGLSELTDNAISHDKATRFLSADEYTSQHLWHLIKPEVRKYQQAQGGVLILDDTIEEKPYTDENDIVCWHFSHAKNDHVKGMNLLSCLVRYGEVSFPIGFEVVKKDVCYWDEIETRYKRKASISKNELFQGLVSQAVKNKVSFDYVLADNWFGSKANMELIHYGLKKTFIFGIKSNRTAALSEQAKIRGQFQKVSSIALEDEQATKVWLKGLDFPVQLLKKIFTNEDGSAGSLYLVTNDLTIVTDRIYEVYQKRWRIEEYHKSIKQNASLAKSPTKTARTQNNHIFAAIWAFCKLEMLKVKTCLNHFAIKYRLILRANQMAFKELRELRGT
jgi:hypothetical protein